MNLALARDWHNALTRVRKRALTSVLVTTKSHFDFDFTAGAYKDRYQYVCYRACFTVAHRVAVFAHPGYSCLASEKASSGKHAHSGVAYRLPKSHLPARPSPSISQNTSPAALRAPARRARGEGCGPSFFVRSRRPRASRGFFERPSRVRGVRNSSVACAAVVVVVKRAPATHPTNAYRSRGFGES